MEHDVILEARSVRKLYGRGKSEAIKIMESGGDKQEVYKKTGVAVALWDVSFEVKRGEIFVIIGLSGSGKSTMIRCFNRLLKPTSGSVLVDGREVDGLEKKELLEFRRNKASMVFQNFGLFSHRTVIENVYYGLEVKGVKRQERELKAIEMIKMVGLDGWENMPISSLSGGMKQRVGIARALTNSPDVLLMDEPFSALDPLVRRDMQFELLQIQRKLGKTILFITHDINEAFKLGDTVAIMREGKVVQIATPEEMASNPADDYVRQFIDSADKTKVLSVKQIMSTPTCLIKERDDITTAIREMRVQGLSSAFVVDGKMQLVGVVTIDSALKARQDGQHLADIMEKKPVSVAADMLISDVVSLAAETKYPICVLDEDGMLKGIISKAAILSSII